MEDDPSFIAGNTQLPNGSWRLHRRITDDETLDLQFSYEFKKPEFEDYSKDTANRIAGASIWQRVLWGTKLTAGVNNAFDRQPPSVLAAFNDNYDTSNYSFRNRYWYVSLNKKF
jgi:outer membrane receptor protein involved in Fe transport